MEPLLKSMLVLLFCSLSATQTLDPEGKNVCQNVRDPSTLVCCSGWRQKGTECSIPLCEGELACQTDELCVYPGVCRCPPGYYGAQCKTRCPAEFWAPDCREVCRCFPHGRCDPVTGECTCNSNRWGPLCQHTCKCTRHGRCHPTLGNCTCDEGWWAPTCAIACQCHSGGAVGAACDQLSGGCQCGARHWGLKCSKACRCYLSPCHPRSGVCQCQEGWWGPDCARRCNCDPAHSRCDPADGACVCQPGYMGAYCNQPCQDGRYGSGCTMSCGHCRDRHACAATDGLCPACEPGWNGTHCDRRCLPGYYGDGCRDRCPRCRGSEACDVRTGACLRCNPGWTGSRCEEVCSDGTYGDACRFLCSPCFHGNCHHVTGRCVCHPGFQGESCNSSCPVLQYGLNCSSVCDCGEGVSCHPATGACPSSVRGAVLAGVLVPVLLLLLVVLCCCLCCGGAPADAKDRVPVGDGDTSVRIKYHVYNVLANITASIPCISAWSSGLPRVTVSHHDQELTFNHSFIEPPSSGWVIEGSSFDSDEEEEEAHYCVPPREDIPAVAGGEFQEMSSKCNMFMDPSGFSGDDIAMSFNIPRTSSLAKSKRPSVSFAEGTRFSPKERRGSAQDVGAPPGAPRTKPKSPWGVLMLSTLQAQGGVARSGEEDGSEGTERGEGLDVRGIHRESSSDGVDQEVDKNSLVCFATPQAPQEKVDKVTTVYVTVGRAGRPMSKAEPSSSGPVQAMLRRLGSLQRQKEQDATKPKSKAGGIVKPPRRKLGARASVWEQGGPPGGDPSISKPSRSNHTSVNSSGTEGVSDISLPECGASKRRLSILKNAPDSSTDSGSEVRAEGAGLQSDPPNMEPCEGNNQAVRPGNDTESLTEVIANEGFVASVTDEPSYENIMIKH